MNETTNQNETATILLVDDVDINLALRIARKAQPDLILLDIMMPGIDGYETCARLKSDETTRHSVVIFLSALQSSEEKVRGLSMGAMDFITKPFDPDEIIARVALQLEAHQNHKQLLKQNRHLARALAENLQAIPDDMTSGVERIKNLISSGEGDRAEFKSTLRWNLKTDNSDKRVEKAWLKSVVAFLNKNGGVLLVGVQDDGDILGIDADQFDNEDKYLLHVNNRIKQHIGLEHAGFIRFQLVPVDQKKVLIVECQPSPSPVFLKMGNDEDFYIRIGPGSRKLSTSEVLSYVTNRKT
jgi:DNA-binding response OmpR family regulator